VRALVIHPVSNYNIGDLLTYIGTQEILRAVDPDIEFIFFDMDRAERELDTYMSRFYWGTVDVLVLAGSPWIWFEGQDSAKFRVLSEAIKRFPLIPKIALGIGSCFPLCFLTTDDVKIEVELICNPKFLKGLKDTFGQFNLVVTRDPMAFKVLKLAGVPSFYAKDTSLYAKKSIKGFSNRSRPLCIFQDPTFSLSRNEFTDSYIEEFMQAQKVYIEREDAEIYTISAEDAFSATKYCNREARYVADLDWMGANLRSRQSVLSGRVHMALLADMMGALEVIALPMDSRILTLYACPDITIKSLSGFTLPERVEFTITENELINTLEGILR
jgi:hypothetical protein